MNDKLLWGSLGPTFLPPIHISRNGYVFLDNEGKGRERPRIAGKRELLNFF
jgi:hypothetical protein